MYTHTHIYTHTHSHTHTHIYTHTPHTHTHTHTHTHHHQTTCEREREKEKERAEYLGSLKLMCVSDVLNDYVWMYFFVDVWVLLCSLVHRFIMNVAFWLLSGTPFLVS